MPKQPKFGDQVALTTEFPYIQGTAMELEWDAAKAIANELKHGVSFEEATRVFDNADKLDVDATRDGDGETRRKVMAFENGRLLAVIYTLRNNVVRIISARRTNRPEDILYGNRSIPS